MRREGWYHVRRPSSLFNTKPTATMNREEVERLAKDDDAAQTALLIGLEEDRDQYFPAILGFDRESGKFVYDYDRLVECFASDMKDSDDPMLDATEWVNYNVVRGVPYYGEHAPLILYKDLDDGKVRNACDPDDESADGKYRKYYEDPEQPGTPLAAAQRECE